MGRALPARLISGPTGDDSLEAYAPFHAPVRIRIDTHGIDDRTVT